MPGRISSARRRLARTVGAASCVREPLRFCGRELAGRSRTDAYRVRGSGLRAVVRHPMLDMWVLEEIFRNDGYALPTTVAQRLRSLEQNRADAIERLRAMVVEALVEPKPRRKTRPTHASKQRRLEGKVQRGRVKALRRKSFDD